MRIVHSPLLLGFVLSACYRYVPSQAVLPTAGHAVRLTLSTDATERLAPVLGPSTKSLTGRILANGGNDFAVAVDRTFKDNGLAVVWAGDRVLIPRSGITHTERRVLDRKRSLLAAGGVALGTIASALVISSVRSRAGNGGQPPPPPPTP
jgi:hypothetical protein